MHEGHQVLETGIHLHQIWDKLTIKRITDHEILKNTKNMKVHNKTQKKGMPKNKFRKGKDSGNR